MESLSGTDVALDHVAVAVERHADAWPRYADDLGGRWLTGGRRPGFATAQLVYADGAKVEVLEPHRPWEEPFLRRFVDRHGPGPHHLTFKVPDLRAALQSRRRGTRPSAPDLSDPFWKEAFLLPRQAAGVLVQLAESMGETPLPPPPGFPGRPRPRPATLLHVAHAVASMEEALRLFAGVLGARSEDVGEHLGWRWVELSWSGPGRLRLGEACSEEARAWLGGRRGRVHHLGFRCDSPGAIAGAVATGAGWEVPPEANMGTRLVLW